MYSIKYFCMHIHRIYIKVTGYELSFLYPVICMYIPSYIYMFIYTFQMFWAPETIKYAANDAAAEFNVHPSMHTSTLASLSHFPPLFSILNVYYIHLYVVLYMHIYTLFSFLSCSISCECQSADVVHGKRVVPHLRGICDFPCTRSALSTSQLVHLQSSALTKFHVPLNAFQRIIGMANTECKNMYLYITSVKSSKYIIYLYVFTYTRWLFTVFYYLYIKVIMKNMKSEKNEWININIEKEKK